MSSVEAGPKPLRVSPLIKFARWSLLGMGILYGLYHQRRFSKIEDARREKELREKPMRDAKLAEEKRLELIAQEKMIQELFLTPAKK
ncbi:ATP synthase subunit e, mitochondrial [Colletes gigas]|uniref:ATP synthase subunit e, mitochondrial n=1 Tax=Colletes gigas TaxID=935657 RepID=UPI001C9AD137|nr:ATP synthase subunit e, mitochondrial [Colletes gigas]